MMNTANPYPKYDAEGYCDRENGDFGEPDPFGRLDHALNALRAGDPATALATLAERDQTRDLADRLAGEAENLIRASLLDDAGRRLECAVAPKFASEAEARKSYRKALEAGPAQQHQLSLEDAA